MLIICVGSLGAVFVCNCSPWARVWESTYESRLVTRISYGQAVLFGVGVGVNVMCLALVSCKYVYNCIATVTAWDSKFIAKLSWQHSPWFTYVLCKGPSNKHQRAIATGCGGQQQHCLVLRGAKQQQKLRYGSNMPAAQQQYNTSRAAAWQHHCNTSAKIRAAAGPCQPAGDHIIKSPKQIKSLCALQVIVKHEAAMHVLLLTVI